MSLCLVWFPTSTCCLLICHYCFFQRWRMPTHVATTDILQNTSPEKSFPSSSCIHPICKSVCHQNLLACVTSCLSHYLPVCISVCPPASAPLLPDIFFSMLKWEKGRNLGKQQSLWAPRHPSWLAFICYNTIRYHQLYSGTVLHSVFSILHPPLLHSVLFQPQASLSVCKQAGKLAEDCCHTAKANS